MTVVTSVTGSTGPCGLHVPHHAWAVPNYVIDITLVVSLPSTLDPLNLSKKLKQLIAVRLVNLVHGQDGQVVVHHVVVAKHSEPDSINVLA